MYYYKRKILTMYLRLHIAIDVIEDFENSLSASLNFRLRLSALELVALFDVKYLSQPRIIFPHN